MKVALISMESRCGKTTFAQILGGIYSRSQFGKYVALLTTGDCKSYLDNMNIRNLNEITNPNTLATVLNNSTDENIKQVFDYGIRQGQENVFIFNTTNEQRPEEGDKLLSTCISSIPANLTIVDVQGSPLEERNKVMINKCNVILYVLTPCLESFRAFKEYYNSLSRVQQAHIAVVVSKVDSEAISDRQIEANIGIPSNLVTTFPYSSLIQKYALDRNIESIPYMIYTQDVNWIKFRQKMLDIMQLLFDDAGRKVIRGLDKWLR